MNTTATEKAPVLAMSFPHTGAHSTFQPLPHLSSPLSVSVSVSAAPTNTISETPTPAGIQPNEPSQKNQNQNENKYYNQAESGLQQSPSSLTKDIFDTVVSKRSNDMAMMDLCQDTHEDQPSVVSMEGHDNNSNKRDMQQQQQRHQSNERTIEQVLEKGKILKVSRRLKTRLEYAILKIRRGWSKYTLQEVESLTQPACSPRLLSKRHFSSASSPYSSPRQSHRKRTKKMFPDYEEQPYRDPPAFDDPQDETRDTIMELAQATSSTSKHTSPTRQYRSRPSFSQFKDSELFLPAKSLMDIATSSPTFQEAQASHSYSHNLPSSPGGPGVGAGAGAQSPYGYGSPAPLYRESTPSGRDSPRWASHSSPPAPTAPSVMETTEDEQDEVGGVPSAAQAARTILMLSSPTRPPPRTLQQNYIVEMNQSPTHSPIIEWSGPSYSPMVSSPLVHFQTAASSGTPSPDRRESPQMTNSDASSMITESMVSEEESTGSPSWTTSQVQAQSQSQSQTPQQSHLKPSFGGLYGSSNRYEPSSPSPLSVSLLPSSSNATLHDESPSRSASPTLKRAAKFAAAATMASTEAKLSADKAAQQQQQQQHHHHHHHPHHHHHHHHRHHHHQQQEQEGNTTLEIVVPGSQPGMEYVSQQSQQYTPQHEQQQQQQQQQQLEEDLQQRTYHQHGGDVRAITPPPRASPNHGMQTPPPSVGTEIDPMRYGSGGKGVINRRRNSALAAGAGTGGETDLSALYLPRGCQ
ncbi:hypothetical protein BG004_008038 [Podila humilis]|nr:hypothetical protein BG004_008038 [Podila humilis]